MIKHPDRTTQPTNENQCPDCGAFVASGQAGCQAIWDEIAAHAYDDIRYASVRDLAFDTYCMQHVDRYCRSAKSYAAHLTRLCCRLEYDGDPTVYAAIQKWLNGNVSIKKPEMLTKRGILTIVDVQAARNGEEYRKLVRVWAESVWAAYAEQHKLARQWIEATIGSSNTAPLQHSP